MTPDFSPLKVREIPAFLKAVEPLARELSDGDLYASLARHADAVVTAVAIGARVDRAWLEEQDVEVLIDLAARVMEVNADFFVRRVLPRLTAAIERMGQIGSGGTPSLPASLPPGSPTTA